MVTKVFMKMSYVGAWSWSVDATALVKRFSIYRPEYVRKKSLKQVDEIIDHRCLSKNIRVSLSAKTGGIPPTTRKLAGHPDANPPHYCAPKMLILQFSFSWPKLVNPEYLKLKFQLHIISRHHSTTAYLQLFQT